MALTKIKTGGLTDNSVTDAKVADAITVTGAQTGITQVGTLTTLTVDDITINGSTISDSGDLTLDIGADIILDAGGNEIKLKTGGTEWGQIYNSSSDLAIYSSVQDKDIKFQGNDGGSLVTALTLDMSEGGNATFAGAVSLGTQSSGLNAFNINRARFQSHENNVADMSVNLAYNGSAWVNDNDSQDSQLLRLYSGQGLTYYVSSAQATPNLVSKFSVDTSGNATFSGDVTTDGIFKVDSAPDNDVIQFDQSGRKSAIKTYFSSSSTGSKVIVKVSDGNTNGGMVDALDVRPADAIFAGDVTVDGNRYMLTESGTNKGFFGKDDWATSSGSADNVNVGSYSGTVKITAGAATSSTSNIVCNADKSTTFNGTVTIPSGSYVPDDHANFGIGAIVSNWGTNWDVLNVGHSSAYWCEVGDYADRGAGWGNNVYHNGSNYKSIYEDQVSAITQKAGNIKFYTTGVKGTTTNMTTPGDGDPRVTIQNDGATLFGTASRTATGVGGASFDPNSVGRCLLLLGSVNYTSSVDVARFYNDNGEVGDIRTDGSGASFNSNSDYRLKENEVPLSNALTRLNNLKPYRFNFKADENKTLDGFFAHEVQEVVPEAVTGTKDQMKAIQYQPEDEIPEGKEVYDIKEYSTTEIDPQKMDASKLVPLLVAAVQELSAKVTALENA